MNEIFNEDCVRGMAERLDPGSVDLTVTSIPFGALFMYSGKGEDIGNNQDGTDFVRSMFGLHLRFFCEQLLRVQRPGTNACIHIQQLVSYRVEHGYMGRRDFRGAVVDVFEQAGFEWKGEVTIPKNPQVIAQRQKLHSLLFVTGRRDARQLAPAVNDHLLIFQRPGVAPPVRALRHEESPDGWVTGDEWIRWARGTWDDIRETDVLEGWKHGRCADDEKHVCPLQLEVARRPIKLYTNPGELVLDPFAGIGTVPYVAAEQGRRFVGFELKESYHELAVRNAARAIDGGDEAQLGLEALA
jgi:DNA modification methylase